MTPRGRRLGPEACVINTSTQFPGVVEPPVAEFADRRVECEKSVLRTETEIIQVKERESGDKSPPPRKTKRIVCRDQEKRENHEVGSAFASMWTTGGEAST